MLTVDYGSEGKAMTIPYPAKPPENRGYIDCRQQPDRAAAIQEAATSPALKQLLVGLAEQGLPLFTTGCDIDQKTEDGTWVAGGYIQVAVETWRLPVDTTGSLVEKADDDHNLVVHLFHEDLLERLERFMMELSETIGPLMEARAGEHDWKMQITHHPLVLSNEKASPDWLEYCAGYMGEEELEAANASLTGALIIHFDASADTEEAALVSRETMIADLHSVLTDQSVRALLSDD